MINNEVEKENKIEGIGGWLIIPIIGFFITIIINFLAVINLFLSYSFTDAVNSVLLYLILITFSIIALNMIWKKRKDAKFWCIVALSFYGIINLATSFLNGDGSPYILGGMVGTILWITYFIKSKRVKNTFIN